MKKIIAGILFLSVVIAGALVYFNYQQTPEYTAQQNLNAPIEIPDVGIVKLQEVTDKEKPVVIFFYADWCTYCRRFMPEFGKIAKKFKDDYTFAVVNCDYVENEDYVKNFHIMGFPSLFITDNILSYSFPLNQAVITDNSVFKEELQKYSEFRKGLLQKLK